MSTMQAIITNPEGTSGSGLFLPAEIQRRTDVTQDLKYLAQMVSQGRLCPWIAVEARWTEVAEVVERLLNREIAGKAVLHICQEGGNR